MSSVDTIIRYQGEGKLPHESVRGWNGASSIAQSSVQYLVGMASVRVSRASLRRADPIQNPQKMQLRTSEPTQGCVVPCIPSFDAVDAPTPICLIVGSVMGMCLEVESVRTSAQGTFTPRSSGLMKSQRTDQRWRPPMDNQWVNPPIRGRVEEGVHFSSDQYSREQERDYNTAYLSTRNRETEQESRENRAHSLSMEREDQETLGNHSQVSLLLRLATLPWRLLVG